MLDYPEPGSLAWRMKGAKSVVFPLSEDDSVRLEKEVKKLEENAQRIREIAENYCMSAGKLYARNFKENLPWAASSVESLAKYHP